MAKYYTLLPLPQGKFAEASLVDRAVFGLIWERWRLSNYKLLGGDDSWYDPDIEEVYCVYAHEELGRQLGVSEKTIRRSLIALRDKWHMISWTKASFMGACRYYVAQDIREYMESLKQSNRDDEKSP